MAFEGELQVEQPPWAPNGKETETTNEEATENANQEITEPMIIAWVIDTLRVILTMCIWEPHLFDPTDDCIPAYSLKVEN